MKSTNTQKRKIALIGGGPSALFMYKRLIESDQPDLEVHIFEKKDSLGAGMPYSIAGSNREHITNVSGNEIPDIVTPIRDWIQQVPEEKLQGYNVSRDHFNDYKVLPRLLFGEYLSDQFNLLLQHAADAGVDTILHLQTTVSDVQDDPERGVVTVHKADGERMDFDHIIICTGHIWPKKNEGIVPGYFDSPYPPSKLDFRADHPIAIRGSSLTAIDAIRTLARHHGTFSRMENDVLYYTPEPGFENFKMIMHSKHGLLPAVRFHLEDSHLVNKAVLSNKEIDEHIEENGGFMSLDYLFEKDFKELLRTKSPDFYALVRHMTIEEFVDAMMSMREEMDAFALLKAEYAEAAKSIRKRESIYWKEALAILSFSMNYPAKYLSAEDMLRLQKVLMPLISVVIAFVPQGSAEEMMALHEAGVLDIVAVGDDSSIDTTEQGIVYRYTDAAGEPRSRAYSIFIDSIGQPHLDFDQLPFDGLKKSATPARLRFRSNETAFELTAKNDKISTGATGDYYLSVSGLAIDDYFRLVDQEGIPNDRIAVMAVPLIAGYNPDYSGLDFCEAASKQIVCGLLTDKDSQILA